MEILASTVQQFNTKRKGVWYHQNDGYYFKQSGSRCNKIILKCVQRSCNVKALINNNRIIKLNKHLHNHEPDFEKRRQMEETNISPEQFSVKRKLFSKKIQGIFRSAEFVGPIEEFVTERRGTWYHQHDGYYYRKYQAHSPKIYVECIEQNCNVTAVMNDNLSGSIFIVNNRTHNHPADKDKKIVMLVRKEILSRCKNEDTSLKDIYLSEMAKVDDRISQRIPFTTFKNAMAKNRLLKNPTSPDTLPKFKEMIYAKMDHLTIDGREFFLSATMNFAIFISPSTKKLLDENHLIFCIDSLKCVPKKPFINHAFTIGAIMNDMSFEACKEVFKYIKQEVPLWKPKTVICEFERGFNETIMQIFPDAVVAGSWFQFSQAVLEKSTKLILRQFIDDDVNLREMIRMLMALPLLPANLIKEGLRIAEENAIHNKLHLIDGVSSLFAYMRNQWIFRAGISVYLMSKTVLRTIRIHEEFHDSITSFFGHLMNSHPNIWTFMDILKSIEHDFSIRFSSQHVGQISIHQTFRKKILNARSRLSNENLTVLEFLRETCQLAPAIPFIEENNAMVDIVWVNMNESDSPNEKTDIDDEESIELNYDWDYDDDINSKIDHKQRTDHDPVELFVKNEN